MGPGSKRNEHSVASRPLLFAKTPVFAVYGCKVLQLKLPWARPYTVILGGFSAIALQCQTRITAPTAIYSGGALISPVPPICFRETMSTMGESQNCSLCWSQVFRAILCPPPPLPAQSHTKGLGPWHYPGLPPLWASCARWVGTHLLPEPSSMVGGAVVGVCWVLEPEAPDGTG